MKKYLGMFLVVGAIAVCIIVYRQMKSDTSPPAQEDITLKEEVRTMDVGSGSLLLAEDLEAYTVGDDPTGWLDTGANNGLSETDNFKVFDVTKLNDDYGVREILDFAGYRSKVIKRGIKANRIAITPKD